jgi:thiamine transport system permease protein
LLSPLRSPQNRLTGLLSWLLSFSGTLYMAVPALVLGLGFFLIARALVSDTTAVAPFAVVAANVLIALPFALVILAPAAAKAALRFDRQAMSLGLKGLDRWRIVEWPLMRAELGFAAALSFCFSFGDLGVIALFGSRDFTTLPWLLYQKMGSYRTTEAAGIALVLVIAVLAVFAVVPRLFSGWRHAETR